MYSIDADKGDLYASVACVDEKAAKAVMMDLLDMGWAIAVQKSTPEGE